MKYSVSKRVLCWAITASVAMGSMPVTAFAETSEVADGTPAVEALAEEISEDTVVSEGPTEEEPVEIEIVEEELAEGEPAEEESVVEEITEEETVIEEEVTEEETVVEEEVTEEAVIEEETTEEEAVIEEEVTEETIVEEEQEVIAEEEIAEEPAVTFESVQESFDALVDEYYREFEDELWILFETMLTQMSGKEMMSFRKDFSAVMKDVKELSEEEQAVFEEQYAAEIEFMNGLAEAIEEEAGKVQTMAAVTGKYDTSVSADYFAVISADEYDLAPGATELEIILNNATGTDRKVVHVFEVDTDEESLEVMPGYYAIDKLDPDNLALDGITDKKEYWQAKELTKTVKYYEGMGYNVVGAMNTALAYDSDAPYGYMVWNGVVLGTPEVHKGAQTYLAIDWDGNCELRSMSTPLKGNEKTAISANFGWLVKDGEYPKDKNGNPPALERTSSDASRSMIGIKADGTLIFCQVDGRNGAVSSGLSNYEMGEMMLALGCVNAVNCDGGGSSTFVSKRAGEDVNTMRSVPSDGAERPTINSVILATKAGKTGVLGKVMFETATAYIAPGAKMAFEVSAVDTNKFEMDLPAGVTYQVKEADMGTIKNGTYVAGSTTGTATIQAVYEGSVVGEKVLNVVHPATFGFAADETVLPYGKSMTLEVVTTYGADNWEVCVDGAYTFALSDTAAATLDGNTLTATTDETVAGVDVTVTYTADTAKTDVLKVTFGKGSEIIFDFEDGEQHKNFLGTDEMFAWAKEKGATAPIQNDGNYSENTDSEVFLADETNGQVRNGDHSLGVTLDYTEASFASWSYNMFFHVGEPIVLRDVANGMNATTFGAWVYIPEGAEGLAMQIQGFKNPNGTVGTGAHFYFTTTSGVVKNLNSCTEGDIPASRWVYATVDLTQFGDFFSTYDPYGKNGREPSFIRYYVKPTAAQKLTFYFDDFTLDYSSAVEDRIAPTITGIEYATADTAVSWEGKPTISASDVSFSATVKDANSGLNTKTAQIYVDGNPVDTAVANGKMTASAELGDGYHMVTFEIADKLGNCTQVSRELVVKVNQEKGLVYIDGHNDSGEMPEYDSVYYVDVKTSEAETVNVVEARIQLNTANTWELEQMIVAPGYKVEYKLLDAGREVNQGISLFGVNTDVNSIENVVELTITRTGDCTLTGEQTLVSLPVRLWSWDGVNHVTGQPITPEAQFATGYCPVVTVDYNVLMGLVETVDGETVTFGGSESVATKINDTVYAWHKHDAELTVLNKEATCLEDGYTGRTYCEACKSVVDWGTKVVGDHTYAVVGNQLACKCGDLIKGNGLVTENGKVYYLIADKLVTGWQAVGTEWAYADATTKEVQTGEFTVNEMTYTADENGIVVKGAWVTDAKGTKYSFGPQFYNREWVEIDGSTYYFGTDDYIYTGVRSLPVNRNNMDEGVKWYEFAEDGKFIEFMEGFTGITFGSADGLHYVKEGWSYYGGLMLIDGDYYYARTSGEIVCDRAYYITKTNNLLPVASYTFGADGKMVNPPVVEKPEEPDTPVVPEEPEVKNGIVEEDGKKYYYVDDCKTYGGLMLIDGDYYYARTSGEIVSGKSYYITKTNDLLPAASYTFGADGKMVNPPVVEKPEEPDTPVVPEEPDTKNGIVEEDGKKYWYVNDAKTYGGLMLIDGDYYYARTSGEIVCDRDYWITKTNDLLPEAKYTFGADGKMIDPPVVEKPEEPDTPVVPEEPEVKNGIFEEGGKKYWFVNDVKTYGGLMLIDGDYYYARTSGEIVCGRSYYITKTNDLMPVAMYTFDAEGKMINPPTI